MTNYFEGWYFKHQNNKNTISFIPGYCNGNSFIQIITNDNSYNVNFPLEDYKKQRPVKISNNIFDINGINVDIRSDDISVYGKIKYNNVSQIKYDIMGVFKFFPMECSHSVLSMNHELSGFLNINGEYVDFNNGKGYIEGDRGTSFPNNYTWIHCNKFDKNLSIMASVAKIPFYGLNFWGTTCFVYYKCKEFRLATYKGAKILSRTKNKLIISQGKYCLIIKIQDISKHALLAPKNGMMERTVYENPSCKARFIFTRGNKIIFDEISSFASFEYV